MGERREVRHGHAVTPPAPFVLADALPGLPKLLASERQRHVRLGLVIQSPSHRGGSAAPSVTASWQGRRVVSCGLTSPPYTRHPERLWVIPMNDLEALEVRSLLASHSETFLESAQPWGASWSGLEPHIQASLASFRQQHPGAEILGIELQGSNAFAATNIDHHYYPGDDRTSPRSSLEQVAVRLDVELNRWQKLVAANDRSYIPAMLATGASPEEVARIRAADRAAQGLTPRHQDLAVSDIQQRAEWRGPKVLVSWLERPTFAHSRSEERRVGKECRSRWS